MKNGSRKALILTAAALGALLCVFGKLYVIGEPVSGEQLRCTLSETGGVLMLRADAAEPAVALRGWREKREGRRLYLSAWKVPLSPLFPEGHYETAIDTQRLDFIFLGGEAVWSRGG